MKPLLTNVPLTGTVFIMIIQGYTGLMELTMRLFHHVKNGLVILTLASSLLACGGEGETRPVASKAPPEIVQGKPADDTPKVDLEKLEALKKEIETDYVKVGLLLPLTGAAEDIGKAMLDAASLALTESLDPRLRLIPFDTKGTVEGALEAAEDALMRGVDVVLGPLFASSIKTIKPLLIEAKVPLIGFSNDRDNAGDGTYLLSFSPDQEVARIISFAKSQGINKFAGLIPESRYGNEVLNSLSDHLRNSDASLQDLETYEQVPEKMFEPVKRLANYNQRNQAWQREVAALQALGDDLSLELLKELEKKETLGEVGFEAVLIPEGGEMLKSLVPLLPFYEIDPNKIQFLGTGRWDDVLLIREPPLYGAWFASADPLRVDAFMTKFQTVFKYEPTRIATLAYDGMSLVATLARNPVHHKRFSAKEIEDPVGFMGVDGLFRFHENGTIERGLAVIEIQPSGFTVISPAPSAFRLTLKQIAQNRIKQRTARRGEP